MTDPHPPSVEALQSGDREAFAVLVDQYSPAIYRLALRMLGDPQEAEDVMQETFMNAYRAIDRFEGRSQVSTWLYRIASNQALMRIRKKNPEFVSVDEPITGPDEWEPVVQLRDWCCLPETEFMSSEAMAQLDSAIEELSPALRATFVLRDLQSLSTRETAEILGISESAVKTRLLRARLQLRESLSSYFGDRLQEISHETT